MVGAKSSGGSSGSSSKKKDSTGGFMDVVEKVPVIVPTSMFPMQKMQNPMGSPFMMLSMPEFINQFDPSSMFGGGKSDSGGMGLGGKG